MSTPIDSRRRSREPQTFVPGDSARDELADFAAAVRGFRTGAALVGPDGQRHEIPTDVFHVLELVADALAMGEGITVVPRDMSMTTQQAADFLGISRPTLVKLLEGGQIEYTQPGRHRRVRLQALLEYQEAARSDRSEALAEAARESIADPDLMAPSHRIKRLAELDS
ncbi:helix-turn-helix domain-containing protein [Microbacterium indicum]|uniref:helix-turn-helix domain-containing protein n=1 Tax=Microbacterium indicum TaxID=358100 RepID=UPI000415BD3B|nr:helix-turn-helix domain-containing protein [Microbacterium indicum]